MSDDIARHSFAKSNFQQNVNMPKDAFGNINKVKKDNSDLQVNIIQNGKELIGNCELDVSKINIPVSNFSFVDNEIDLDTDMEFYIDEEEDENNIKIFNNILKISELQNKEKKFTVVEDIPEMIPNFDKHCNQCNFKIPKNSKFCMECGFKIPVNFCVECGHSYMQNEKYCPDCGTKR